MKYKVVRNKDYDFLNQSYATGYPNFHKYPATMLPQIGIKLLKEFDITKGNLLDPYCGSGSSFACGLECGINEMYGYDINPLAILVSKAKFTKVSVNEIVETKIRLRSLIFEFMKDEESLDKLPLPKVNNINYWFSQEVIQKLSILKHFIFQIKDENTRNFFLLSFSEVVRVCSFTRNKEFKLYRMKEEDVLNFNPDVFGVYFKKLNDAILIYSNVYFPKLKESVSVDVRYSKFIAQKNYYDVVLTSPPYGDSRTTVAYGQFSTLSNEWLGIDYARKIDSMLMGGKRANELYRNSIIAEQIKEIATEDQKRALEVSAFYEDLSNSIYEVAQSVKLGGKVFYIVGNRTVKNIQLRTDQFIAEQFEKNHFKHIITIERALSNKAMPSKNSPTNQRGKTVSTMLFEYLVVCERTSNPS